MENNVTIKGRKTCMGKNNCKERNKIEQQLKVNKMKGERKIYVSVTGKHIRNKFRRGLKKTSNEK